jgi:hypothetical protein
LNGHITKTAALSQALLPNKKAKIKKLFGRNGAARTRAAHKLDKPV